jgi:hypothetical protein
LGKTPVAIGFDGAYAPGKMAMNKTYIFVNPVQQTGCVKELDKKRFKELQNRYHKIMKDYKQNGEKIRKEYADAREVLVSEEFWRKYLEI